MLSQPLDTQVQKILTVDQIGRIGAKASHSQVMYDHMTQHMGSKELQ